MKLQRNYNEIAMKLQRICCNFVVNYIEIAICVLQFRCKLQWNCNTLWYLHWDFIVTCNGNTPNLHWWGYTLTWFRNDFTMDAYRICCISAIHDLARCRITSAAPSLPVTNTREWHLSHSYRSAAMCNLNDLANIHRRKVHLSRAGSCTHTCTARLIYSEGWIGWRLGRGEGVGWAGGGAMPGES